MYNKYRYLKWGADMAICPICGKEIKENYLFCGYCGASLRNSQKPVIDGRKNKKIKYIIKKVCDSEKANVTLTLLFTVLFFTFLFIGVKSIIISVMYFDELPRIINQVYFKYGYMKEGLGLSYLGKEIAFVLKYLNSIIASIGGMLGIIVFAFYITFNLRILYLRKKYEDSFNYKKPVRLIKACLWVTKTFLITALVFALAAIIINLAGIIII